MTRLTWRDGCWLMLVVASLQVLLNAYFVVVIHEDWRSSREQLTRVSAGWNRQVDAYLGIAVACRAATERAQCGSCGTDR